MLLHAVCHKYLILEFLAHCDALLTVLSLSVCRRVVPVPSSVCLLPGPHPCVGGHCPAESTDQGGPQVWLAACHCGHVHQQVLALGSMGTHPPQHTIQCSSYTSVKIILTSTQYGVNVLEYHHVCH